MFRCLIAASACFVTAMMGQAAEQSIRFNRDIRAILSDKCFACHGPDAETVEGGLRLDLAEEATDPSLGAIVPGAPDESELVRRILSSDDDQMPPPDSHKSLTDQEQQLLVRWVAQGAVYEPHWAYTPMHAITGKRAGQNATRLIDGVISDRLDQEALAPAAAADPITLIRRLALDLTGIPPTPDQVEQFLADRSEDAYANLVDRLLNSPRYGERMATYWLDLVRYADTVGYHGDQNVSQSPYRDYVINAFNDNLPYDQFVREQLAGDLLPDATLQQRVASGYNRLNQTTEEGGSQAKEYLAIYFADRVRNVSQVFMGATVGCAQCHDHKYDPYTARDFYSLGAFFADLDERGVYSARSRPPMIRVPSNALQQELDQLDLQIQQTRSRIPGLTEKLIASQPAWENTAKSKLDDRREIETAWIDDQLRLDASPSGDLGFVSGDDVPVHRGKSARRQQSDGLVQHLFSDAKEPLVVGPDTRFYAWVHLNSNDPPAAIMLQFNDGNWSHRKVWGGDEISYGRKPKSDVAYQRAGELPEAGTWVRLEVDADEVGLAPGAKVNGMAFTQFGGLVHWDDAGVITVGQFPPPVVQALQVAADDRTTAQQDVLRSHYLAQAAEMIALENEIKALTDKREKRLETAPLTVVSESVSPRPIRILPRGNWMDDSGEIVQAAIPAFLGDLQVDGRATRLDLANWLCRDDNPLTARTMVNRVWSLLFGRGICTSVDDFGGQGTYPSYPDLLDALSIEFVESGWDIKQLIRTIVSSESYRRSSTPTAEMVQRDPYNDLFARQGRFGVDAEVVRDTALSVSGLLVEQIGGPSVHPYQPPGYYAQLNFPRREYAADEGKNQYRRGLYTHWQRTFLHPMLKAFDAPSREECTAMRARSNTPLQALVLLNDPSFVEAARVFAERIMREGGEATDQRVDWAYRCALSGKPDPAIGELLCQLYQRQLAAYQADADAATKLISQGASEVATDLNPAELAAWTNVARAILNLHETITRY
ncbi:PSD1 and planctomycete cytochrome C domain-containing protein [Stieleria sp. TO1_6]|uniref:PSD1 and planctomycete cytochrome C domain-containing protein n=1 Tax=Stieleria tagensis TaxID=2956795 RepID=UPI00209AB55F|nr:PSD1 and planctomycete cytochrome C domain-containing protein [Stieleria tagensis]MCO8121437.1 PSD1 and planctomycete cytochrome C domain-containing protein [Stieleria tagensis]